MKIWTVTMHVEAPDNEDAPAIVTLIENALDADAILSDLLDVTLVTAHPGDA